MPTLFDIKKTSYIYREDNEILSSGKNIINDNDKKRLMKLNVYSNSKDIVFEFEKN